jgi:eukaryotic-like serine/threonine-protein kinase
MATLGRYRVEKVLHRGGMGEILLAKTDCPGGFARQVVIKRLKQDLTEDPTIRTLFEREAYLLARLHHPNIVRAVDYFYVDGTPHLVLEHIQGRNLRNVVFQARKVSGQMPIRYALYVVAQLCRGLHYTHHARDHDGRPLQIAHRDICPSNVMVSYFGEVKVTDFGIASMAGAERLTGPGFFRGKVQYASPEQITGEGFGVSSDVYSAGVVLAEMLSGKMLFNGTSAHDTVHLVLSENRERTIDRILEGVRPVPGLRTALRGALAVLPADRFPTALQFAEALEAVARLQSLTCTPAQLGLFLRRVYDGEADLPVDDIFDWNAGAVPSFADETEIVPSPLPRTESREVPESVEVARFVEQNRKRKGLLAWLPFVGRAAIFS